MATIQEMVEFAKQNPDNPYSVELRRRIESGQLNDVIKQQTGKDVSVFLKQKTEKPTIGQVAGNISFQAGEFGKGILKGAGRTLVDLAKTGQQARSLIGIGQLGFKGPEIETPEVLEPQNLAQRLGGYAETAAEILAPLPGAKQKAAGSLISRAQRIYESALKPSTALSPEKRAQIIRTGLKEGVRLTKGGVQKTADRIESLETELGKAIDAAGERAGKIKTSSLKPFIDESKKLFEEIVDVNLGEKASQKIDRLYENFASKYGDEIPVDVAQKLKTNTYRYLQKAYGKLSTSTIEGSKALARGLKEGIVEVAPKVKGVNERLSKLYEFEKALERASGRIGNLNVISLGTKVLAGVGGKPGAALAVLNQLAGGAGTKSSAAIFMNRLGEALSSNNKGALKALEKAAPVLFGVDLNTLIQKIRSSSNPPTTPE